jgi:cysteine desulfuration protein SufE
MTIEEIENEIVDEFSFFSDWTDKYQYIIELGNKLSGFPKDKMTDEYKIKGCQSSVWLVTGIEDGKIVFKAYSDSTIVQGLIALLIRVLSGQRPDDIINAKLGFIDELGLRQHLTRLTDRYDKTNENVRAYTKKIKNNKQIIK